MLHQTLAAVALAALSCAGSASAQRPSSTSLCDFYTAGLLKENTDANQLKVLTLLVNTVVVGNYSEYNKGIAVPGILANGTVNGTAVNLLPYFSGALVSSNHHGVASAVNFLDGGGAEPLLKSKPANDNTSNQYFLLTHLYSFFGALLGCSKLGGGGFPAYTGNPGMYEVHKFMDLNAAQVGYFVQQVHLAALSFGVLQADADAVADVLYKLFDVRCGPALELIPHSGPQLQSICIDAACPLAANQSDCQPYGNPQPPAVSNGTAGMGNATMSMGGPGPTATDSMGMPVATNSMGMPTGTATGKPTASATSGAAAFAARSGVAVLAVVGTLATLFL